MTEDEFKDQVLFYALLQSAIAALGIGAGVGIAIYLYWREQKERRLEIISRSCETILWELKDNKETLSEGKHQRISYDIASENHDNVRHVLYTNAYLYDEAYRTLINSGSFSYFNSTTQYKLVSLYGRIRSHNELITYADELQDRILIAEIHDRSGNGEQVGKIEAKSETILFRLRERYDLTLTKWEDEINRFILEVEELINEQKPHTKRT